MPDDLVFPAGVRAAMFEVLTRQEAEKLRDKLTDGYNRSKRAGVGFTGMARDALDPGFARSANRKANEQAAMRQENTMLRSMIYCETQDYD